MIRLRFSTLLLFLLPALISLAIVAILNILTINQFSKTQIQNRHDLEHTVLDLQKTIGFIDFVGQHYKTLDELLLATNAAQLSHAEAYLIHSRMVDALALTENQLNEVKRNLENLEIENLRLQRWQDSFQNFKNFSLMASDIVVIDPKTSSQYINSAKEEYFAFVDESNRISKQLTRFTNQTFETSDARVQEALQTNIYTLAIGFILAFFIALIFASRLSSFLQMILVSLRELADFRQEVPSLDNLTIVQKRVKGELLGLTQAVLKFRDTLLLHQSEKQRVFQLAYFDELTGLPNMQKLRQDLEQELAQAYDEHHLGVLVKMNINHFKLYNNALGYDVGDQILVHFANRLASLQSKGYQAYRGSADEYYLLVPLQALNPIQVMTYLNDLTEEIRQEISQPLEIDHETIHLTCNLGIVDFPHDTTESVSNILRNVIIALHRAKEFGENEAMIYEPAFSQQITEHFELQKDLVQAIQNHQLEVYLQSQVEQNQPIHRAEALIRWNHPTKGWIQPDVFIRIAEETNLILDIDIWMLTQVCRLLKAQADKGVNLHISVNISGFHFAHPEFVENVMRILEETQVNPSQLTLELTENVFLEDFGSVIRKMRTLIHQGIRFSIDDFGTGYSSLSYLKRLPVNEIKIDRVFIQNITDNQEDLTLVKAVFDMAQTFKLDVVVEGVETYAQESVINEFGNPIIQGYLYAKPIPAEEWISKVTSVD